MMVCFVVSLFYFAVLPKIQDAPLNRLDGWFGVDLFLLQGECASVRINGSRV